MVGRDRAQGAPPAAGVDRPGDVPNPARFDAAAAVGRTAGWLSRHLQLSKDYEALPEVEEASIHVAMIGLMNPTPHPSGCFLNTL